MSSRAWSSESAISFDESMVVMMSLTWYTAIPFDLASEQSVWFHELPLC